MFAEHYLWSAGGFLAERPWSLSFNRLFQSISETLIFRGKFDIYYKLKHRVVEIFTIQARHKLRLHDEAKHKTSAKLTFRWVLLAIGPTWSCLMLTSEYYNRENYNKLESKLPWYFHEDTRYMCYFCKIPTQKKIYSAATIEGIWVALVLNKILQPGLKDNWVNFEFALFSFLSHPANDFFNEPNADKRCVFFC